MGMPCQVPRSITSFKPDRLAGYGDALRCRNLQPNGVKGGVPCWPQAAVLRTPAPWQHLTRHEQYQQQSFAMERWAKAIVGKSVLMTCTLGCV